MLSSTRWEIIRRAGGSANWGSVGMLPEASADREARLLIFAGGTGRWKAFLRP